jgi:hypothetical protein
MNQWLRVGSGAHSLILVNNQTRVRIRIFLGKFFEKYDFDLYKKIPWKK